jgi:hypothetical protein
MTILASAKKLVPLDHPLRLAYHKLRAMIAASINGFPANRMIVIGVTGTDGKTTTCNMIFHILRAAGACAHHWPRGERVAALDWRGFCGASAVRISETLLRRRNGMDYQLAVERP